MKYSSNIQKSVHLKALSDLRQFLLTESRPLKMMKNDYFNLKAFLVVRELNFCLYFLVM